MYNELTFTIDTKTNMISDRIYGGLSSKFLEMVKFIFNEDLTYDGSEQENLNKYILTTNNYYVLDYGYNVTNFDFKNKDKFLSKIVFKGE